MQKTRFLKVKSTLLKLEKHFIELKEKELKNKELKVKKIIIIVFKPIFVSIDDMDKFEQKEMKKKRSIKNNWYDWLINHIPKPVRKTVGGFKNKVVKNSF